MKRTCLQETHIPMKMSVCEFHPTIKKTNYLRMKTKVLLIAVMMSLSAVLAAQPADRGSKKPLIERDRVLLLEKGQRGQANGLNLTEEQKAAF